MAVRRSTKASATRRTEVSLPAKPSVPSTTLSDYSILLFGEKKIGKTSLAAQFPDAMFLMLEPGGKALRIYQASVRDWPTFVAYVDQLESDSRFKTIVLDTVDLAYEACFNHVCKQAGIDHPSDEHDYGKTWGLIDREFSTQMTRVLSLGKGVIFISHEATREFVSRDGLTFDRIGPSMAKQAARFLEGVVDIWAHYGYWGQSRHILIQGNELIGAGCRLEDRFRTLQGDRVISIPGGGSSKEAYDNFIKAFNNQQKVDGAALFARKSVKTKSR